MILQTISSFCVFLTFYENIRRILNTPRKSDFEATDLAEDQSLNLKLVTLKIKPTIFWQFKCKFMNNSVDIAIYGAELKLLYTYSKYSFVTIMSSV